MSVMTKDQNTPQEGFDPSDRYLLWMLSLFLKPYVWHLVLVFLLLVGVSLLSLLPPFLIQQAVDGPIANGNADALAPIAVVYMAVVPLIFGMRFYHTYLLQMVGQNALVGVRQRLFDHIMRLDMRYFNTTPVGQIVARLTTDVEALTELLSTSIVMVLSSLLTLVGLVVAMFLLNWQMALFALAVLPIMVGATIYFRKAIRAMSGQLHKVAGDYLAYTNEQMNGMLIVQLFGQQEQSREDFDTVNRAHRDTHITLRDQYTRYASINMALSSAGLCMTLIGGGLGIVNGWATIGVVLAMIQYSRRTFEPILMLAEQFSQIQMALAAGERMARLLKVDSEIVEPEQPTKVEPTGGLSVTFDNVTFGYDPDTPVLRGIDVHIPANQSVAIVGATGAGKTSLAGLLARFYDVTGGAVKINGVDVRELSNEELRRYVMVVPQSPYCFYGTVAENLKLFDNNISDEKMVEAARLACAAPFIERLPGGYDFKLLPGGGNLSQGQRQLLALARALLHNPDSILVLDEATSNIDTEMELLIQRGLKQVMAARTSIVIAHRLSTIREADRILVMRRGKVVEEGNHVQLLKKGGLYAELYQRQFADDEAYDLPVAGD
ncbi:MAG: ABC transporter ATP-binding protein/permease [Anaerolineae bacterium]|nr:ABC transporter ATP-binding protein/permease [Anaerolineae bacterium]